MPARMRDKRRDSVLTISRPSGHAPNCQACAFYQWGAGMTRQKLRGGQTMRKNLAIAFTSLVVLFGVSTFLTACNTVQGVGMDVSHAGKEISEEAKEHK